MQKEQQEEKEKNEQQIKQLLSLNAKKIKVLPNFKLAKFIFGIYKDNALNYFLRTQNDSLFRFLLKRGCNPMIKGQDGRNTLHYCVSFQRLQSLEFLLFGSH